MPVFAYKAYNAVGGLTEGTLTADTPASARQMLRERSVKLIEFAPVRFRQRRRGAGRMGRGKRQEQASEFARQLAMLLRTGVPVVEALDVLIRQRAGRMLPILRDMREKVASGQPLAEALQAHPTWFDNVFCSAVRVGQMSGNLDGALQELAMFVRERQTIKAKLFTALAYPMLLAVVGTGVVLFLMSYVVPQLLTVLDASGRSLPAATVFLKAVSDTLTGHWLLLLVLGGGTVGSGAALYRWNPGRVWCHRSVLALPVLGVLVRKALIAQFAQTMALLLRSGVPFLDALRVMHGNARNRVLSAELEGMIEAIKRGSDIAPTLADSRIFPPLVVHIVDVGQKTGELPDMLGQLKEGYETEVRLAIGKATAVLEPALIVLMSAVVGFVVFATMMPILEATKAMQ